MYFKASLDSIFHQTLLPDEVILVEDGPLTSELEQIVYDYSTRYPVLKIVPLPTNQGLGKALNEGLKHCSYDLVARMDTDDIAMPDRFRRQIQIFEEHPEIDVCGAWVDEFEGNKRNILSTRKLPEYHEEIAAYAKRRNPINHPVVMFRKSAVIAAGGYQRSADDPSTEQHQRGRGSAAAGGRKQRDPAGGAEHPFPCGSVHRIR